MEAINFMYYGLGALLFVVATFIILAIVSFLANQALEGIVRPLNRLLEWREDRWENKYIKPWLRGHFKDTKTPHQIERWLGQNQ